MTEPKWEHGTFGSISRIRDGHREYLTADVANALHQRISDLEARAARYRRMAYEHGCSSAFVCDDCEREWGGESPFNQDVEWEDWLARYHALNNTTKETQ